MANILLADDDAAVRDLVRRALTSDGHTVHVTQDGGEALDYFEANAASIIVSAYRSVSSATLVGFVGAGSAAEEAITRGSVGGAATTVTPCLSSCRRR